MANGELVVRRIDPRKDSADWLRVPFIIHANDPAWIAPLNIAEKQRISSKHNPFFAAGAAAFFVAYRDGFPVGRVSAQVNRRHLEQHNDETGHFGFFNSIADKAVAKVLLKNAANWLRARGMKRIAGPYSLSINEDPGLLVAGFEEAPALLTGHATPCSGAMLEDAGYKKSMDLFAYRMKPDAVPPQILRLAKLAEESETVRLRHFDMSRYNDEVALIFDIFNDAWSENWGFIPFTEADVAHLIRETRPFMQAKFSWIVEISGKPAAMMVVLPDLNRVIAPFKGRLLPFNWLTLLREIRKDRWKTARVPLLGIRKQYQSTVLGPAVLSLMLADLLRLGQQYDLDWIEFSWILETNRSMTKLAEMAAGPPKKVYRLYEKAL